jgi:hypothetical protein
MGRSMAHIAHRPGPVCLEGGCEPLAGRSSGWWVCGGGAAPAAHRRRVGRFFNSTGVLKRAGVPRPSGTAPEGLPGMAELRRLFLGQEEQSNGFATCHNPQAPSNAQEEKHSCARAQVEIARPQDHAPVLTPPPTSPALSCE